MATYAVTGANKGIGLEFCRQLKEKNHNIIAICRSNSIELDNLGVRVESQIDITSEKSLKKLKKSLDNVSIDVLINNAGILEKESLFKMTKKTILNQFEVNALAPLYLSSLLLDNLKEGSKIILISSRMGSISDNSSGGYYGYRMSKAALCMAGKSLAIDLKKHGLLVGILHPGLVRTEMTKFSPDGISTESSVKGLIKRIDEINPINNGSFRHSNGEYIPW
tara:strand:+ start:1145 stop:1810 length:666 start_codon:yes stop_codon:yes gene_type:complete